MNKQLISILKYVLGLGLGLLLLYLAISGVDLDGVKDAFARADYTWVALGLLVALASHWFRAARWKLLLEAAGYSSNTLNLFAAIMVGYMVNQAVPRAGEVSRATLGAKTERIPVSVSFGTMVTDRIFDVICLLLIVLLVFVLQFEQLQAILDRAFSPDNAAAASNSSGGSSWILYALLAAGAVGLAVLVLFKRQLSRISLFNKGYEFVGQMWQAVLSVRNMKKPGLFLFHTVAIWVSYIMMTYLVFFALEETSGLPFLFALTAFTMGGIGMVIPSPGGIGSYHYAIKLSFVAYAAAFGWSEAVAGNIGTNIAFIIHTSQLIMMIVVGFLAYLYLVPKVKLVESKDSPEPVTD